MSARRGGIGPGLALCVLFGLPAIASAQRLDLAITPATIVIPTGDPDLVPVVSSTPATIEYRVRQNNQQPVDPHGSGGRRSRFGCGQHRDFGGDVGGDAVTPVSQWHVEQRERADGCGRRGERGESIPRIDHIQVDELMDVRRRHLHTVFALHAEHAVAAHRIAIATVVAAALLLAPRAADAQVSAEASPLRVEIAAAPGGSHTQSVTVTNPGTERVRVRTTLTDWFLAKDGAPQFQDPQDGRPYAAAAWVRFAPPEFVLEPGKQGIGTFHGDRAGRCAAGRVSHRSAVRVHSRQP